MSFPIGHRTERGYWWWRDRWMSFWSGPHEDPPETCRYCLYGHWCNAWGMAVSSFFYRRWPDLWRWWVNR